jgi:L-malate glycosyltransferase
MRIGIASPVEVASLEAHLPNLTPTERQMGLGGTAVNIIIDGLIKAGHSVIIFSLDPKVKGKHIIEGVNLKIIMGNFRTSSVAKLLDFCSKESRQIKQFINDEINNVDLVNAHWTYEFAVGTILAKVPHLITFRDDSLTILKLTKHPYRLMRLLLDYWVRNNGKAFSYNSEYLKLLINIDGIVIPNPIKDSEIIGHREYPRSKRIIQICYIANGWDYRKNPENAIRAFSLLLKKIPHVQLHLIGGGFEHNGIGFKKMEDLELNQNVIYRGRLAHHELMIELNNFDIMLHTAREESFGNNLIEAMAKGLPVIGGRNSGAVSWVIGDSGCLVDIENVNEIAESLERLIEDENYYEYLSKKGFENIQKRFSQKEVSEAYINEFKKIISRPN